jgi:hypothetical protein
MFNEHEIEFQCPYCAQFITFLVESLYGNQDYIEDCEVCCQPIRIHYTTSDGEVENFSVDRAD